MASAAFQKMDVLSQSEHGLLLSADIRILGLETGELKVAYTRTWASVGRVRTELSATGYKEAMITADGKAWKFQSSRPTPLRIIQINEALAPLFHMDAVNILEGKTKIKSGKVRGVRSTCAENTDWILHKRCFDQLRGLLLLTGNKYWRTEYFDFQPFGAKVFPAGSRYTRRLMDS